jgi:hypothetical protein
MTQGKSLHLTEKEIIQAVMDETDLPESTREHLRKCHTCRHEKEGLGNQLSLLGNTAKRLSPLPRKSFKLPQKDGVRIPRVWRWQWQSLLAAGMAAAMIFIVLLWKTPSLIYRQDQGAVKTVEFVQDEQFMADISSLVENPLPEIYFDLSGESNSDVDEDFINFVIPDIDNLVRHNHKKKEVYYG